VESSGVAEFTFHAMTIELKSDFHLTAAGQKKQGFADKIYHDCHPRQVMLIAGSIVLANQFLP
jgi:hypothetical protein